MPRTEKKVYGGHDAVVVILYSEKLAKKQQLMFDRALRRLKAQMRRPTRLIATTSPRCCSTLCSARHERSRLHAYLD